MSMRRLQVWEKKWVEWSQNLPVMDQHELQQSHEQIGREQNRTEQLLNRIAQLEERTNELDRRLTQM